MSARSPTPSNACSAWDRNVTHRCTPGASAQVVEALQALRGVPGIVAVTTVAALGDRTRVDSPSARMQGLGLIPAAYASGARRRQGARTNAGNTQARRALGEGAGACRSPANVRRPRQRRLDIPPQAIQDLGGKAHLRLCPCNRRLLARGQHAHHVVVAIARAWVGCMGAMATRGPLPPEGPTTKAEGPMHAAGVPVEQKRRRPGGGQPSTA
jgi:transposase